MKRNLLPLLKLLTFLLNCNLFCQSYTKSEVTAYQFPLEEINPSVHASVSQFNSADTRFRISLLDKITPIDLHYTQEVESEINYFLTKRRSDIELYIQRSAFYFPLIEQLLDKYDLPLELKYIAVIESGLNPLARSSSGATGIWQFLYSTCSLFDLQVNSYIDERRDIFKSTEAACRYLQYLYRTYNDWNLVLISYNSGPGEVRKAIERSDGKTDYWDIRPMLSQQAQNYIPVFVAMNYLMNYYSLYGIEPRKSDYTWNNVDTLHISYAVTFDQISSILNISVSEIEKLNPVYRRRTIPDLDESCVLILPVNLVPEYIRNEKRIIAATIPEPNYNTLLAYAGSTSDRVMITHIVKSGEYFHKIALHYNCTIENIRAWNNLSTLDAFPGQVLKIWIPNRNE
jgi:membrane-bound lytic murein transglycosylase D